MVEGASIHKCKEAVSFWVSRISSFILRWTSFWLLKNCGLYCCYPGAVKTWGKVVFFLWLPPLTPIHKISALLLPPALRGLGKFKTPFNKHLVSTVKYSMLDAGRNTIVQDTGPCPSRARNSLATGRPEPRVQQVPPLLRWPLTVQRTSCYSCCAHSPS